MLPGQAARAREWVREGAAEQGRAAPIVASYVRVAVGPSARDAFVRRRASIAPSTRAIESTFAAMDLPVGSVGIAASDRSDLLEALAPYHSALDLPIVRVLADATLLSAVADTAAP
jgi:hypothetical protein